MAGQRKVLIVDDDENLCYLLSSGLRLKGWNPVAVGLPDSMPMKTIEDSYRLREAGGKLIYIVTGAPIDAKLQAICDAAGADGLITKSAPDFTLGLKSIFGE